MATRQQAHGCSAPAIGPRGPHARRGLSTKPRCMTKATVTSRYRWHVSQNLTRGASCGSRNFGCGTCHWTKRTLAASLPYATHVVAAARRQCRRRASLLPRQRCSSRGATARSRALLRRWLLRGGSAAAAPRCFSSAALEPRRAGTEPCAPAAVTAARRQCCRRASLLLGSGARAAALVRSRARLRRWLLRCGSASIAMVYYTSASIAILHYTYTYHTRLVCGTSPLPSVVGAQRAAPGPSRCGREPSHCCHSVGLAAAPGCKTGPAPARA